MSNKREQRKDEQTQEQPPKWGDPISPERQAELQGYLDRWEAETDYGARKGPFASVHLTGADVSWLAEQSGRDTVGAVPNLHLEGAILRGASLERAFLYSASGSFSSTRVHCSRSHWRSPRWSLPAPTPWGSRRRRRSRWAPDWARDTVP